MDTDNSQDSGGREGTFFYSTLPLPPDHEHSDIYLQLCMWDNYHIFLITPLVFTILLLDETIWLIDDVGLVFVCLRDDLILAFLLQQFETGTRGLELESTITLVLQGNRLTFRCDECCSSCFHKCYITTIFNNSSAERHECRILLYLLFVFRHKLTH